MFRTLLSLVVAGLVLPSTSTAKSAMMELTRNGSFEVNSESDPAVPSNWAVDGVGPVFTLDTAVHRTGRHSLRIGFAPGLNKDGYSGAIQRVNPGAAIGKRVRLSAYLRKTAGLSKAGIWLMVVGPDKQRLSYRNSYDQREPSSKKWTLHTVEADIPAGSTAIVYGSAIHENVGEMWVDDFALVVLEAAK
jgi:hypothetical protein